MGNNIREIMSKIFPFRVLDSWMKKNEGQRESDQIW